MAIKKVLVVDDSKTELMFMTDLLQKSGFSVKTAENAEDAFRRLAEEKPDLILMDVVMPGQNGFQLTRARQDRAHRRQQLAEADERGVEHDRADRLRKVCRRQVPRVGRLARHDARVLAQLFRQLTPPHVHGVHAHGAVLQ